ncbi:Hsp70 family protein [Actinoplanes sp. Pm04-4]|uniref:Hsp70 family protein n=1 Tax=Paractinoplanes pyxinae TaxID=2997416 RepID=A0ABT4B1Y6_9ACTN|nr:Hsp70 family protein [Actinoplanes pyxinae]MCY1139633.1 Hsp70 family protein [Actinoplanes pyxinae]
MAFHKVIGIDLGTTYSAVTVWDGRDTVIIESRMGTRAVPSVVGLDPEGQVIVGTPAQNSMVSNPENTVIEVKRDMGVYARQPTGSDAGQPKLIPFRGRDYLPQEISAFILKELKRQAEDFIGEPVHDAVITVPAYFREPQRRATEEAARIARLNVRRLINEPTSAAVCFGADKAEGDEVRTYAVYDLGGGTFDVSLIQVSPGNVSVVGTGGDPHLGGGDFDDRIVEWALAEIQKRHGVDLSGDKRVRRRIKREAEIRKRELSTATTTMLDLPFLTAEVSANIPLSRATFESLIKDLLDRSLECLEEALDSAYQSNGIERADIEQVLLVGGSTRIARIRPMLADHLGMEMRDIRGDINPDEVVARGAGMVAREFTPADGYEGQEVAEPQAEPAGAPQDEGGILILQDVTSHSLGVHTEHGRYSIILPKDSRIPGSATQHYTNAGPFTALDILVFQGEQPASFDNDLVGTVPITFPEPRERGYWDLATTFSLDVDGLLTVDVVCVNNKDAWQAKLHCGVQSDRATVERSAERAEQEMARPEGAVPPPPPEPPAAPPEPVLPPPTDAVPEQFKSIARRAYKLIGRLDPEPAARLREGYLALLAVAESGSSDLEDVGDALEDLYIEVR